jgi:predicted nucleic acid-binding protein
MRHHLSGKRHADGEALAKCLVTGRVARRNPGVADVGLGDRTAGEPTADAISAGRQSWFSDFMASRAIVLVALTAETLIDSWSLPSPLHNDPADRVILATARAMDAPVMTRDKRILNYAAEGHVRAIPC